MIKRFFRQKTHTSTPSNDGVFLVVGLGNPGTEYETTRHNIGFLTLDHLHQSWHAAPWRKKFSSDVAEARVKDKKIVLLKPQTFMNLSGNAVTQTQLFYKVPIKNVIVIHDELDLKPGVVKQKTGGGDAGHNGLKSITKAIGREYQRIRLGIGHPREETPDMFAANPNAVATYVLQALPRTQLDTLPNLADEVHNHIETIISAAQ